MTNAVAFRRALLRGLVLLLACSIVLFAPQKTPRAASAGEPQAASRKDPSTKHAKAQKQPSTKRTAQKDAAPDKSAAPDEHPFPKLQKAPSLDGGIGWINTAGPIDLKQLRGKFVLLDFWTYCCINCMHILPHLKKLEQAYPNEIVVIGVHSAKFSAEEDSKNIEDAVMRYEIEHPIVNDANHKIWDAYRVQSWPTLMVIDPEGNLVAGNSGEVDFDVLDKFFKRALPYYRRKGLLDLTPLRFELAEFAAEATPLRYPGKLTADETSDRLFIADSNHNRIVVTRLDGTLIDVVGSGQIGATDGSYARATFNHPQGMALAGDMLYVADTENHLLRKVDLKKKQVHTIAGTGQQGRGWPGMDEFVGGLGTRKAKFRFVGPPIKTAINSPWALWVQGRELYIAMAGPHQIWRMSLTKPEIGPFAGNGREDIVDGPLLPGQPFEEGFASFAQPSGLTSDGKVLYVADSEGSSIRAVPFDASLDVQTVVGTSWLPQGRLFAFGDVDGQGQRVRLQHALDVLYHDGLLYVADTYNNKIKVVDPRQQTCITIAGIDKPANPQWSASIKVGDMRYTVMGVSTSKVIKGSAGEESADATFLVIDVSVTNDGKQSQLIPKFQVVDEAGAEHDASDKAWVLDKGIRPLDRLNPGVEKRGTVAFDVPPSRMYKLKVSNRVLPLRESPVERDERAKRARDTRNDPAAFDEPAGLAYAKGKLYVADTNNHRIRTIDLAHGNKVATLEIKDLKAPELPDLESKPSFPGATEVELPATKLKSEDGKIRLHVALELPEGYKINELAPLRYLVESSDAKGPIDRSALDKLTTLKDPSAEFDIELPITSTTSGSATGSEELKISLVYYYCQEGSEGICKAGSVIWKLGVTLTDDTTTSSTELPFKVR